jgi:peptidoglycan/LPS O-acetylase OafA/YrhL
MQGAQSRITLATRDEKEINLQASERTVHRHAFVAMDSLRGLAAFMVVIYHYKGFFGFGVPHAYLAVDFFYMLSGFVMAHAYQKRLDTGLSSTSFMKSRLIRLYPLYLAGLLLAVVFVFLNRKFGRGTALESSLSLPALTALALLFVPVVNSHPNPPIASNFPLNPPSWSLFDELVANLFHVLVLRRRSVYFLVICILITGSLHGFLILTHGTSNFGWNQSEVFLGLPRVLFAYLIGCLLQRVHAHRDCSPLRRWFPLAAVTLVAIMFIPVREGADLVSIFLITFLMPLILLSSAEYRPKGVIETISTALGSASYAAYVLHAPLGSVFAQIYKRAMHHNIETQAPFGGIAFLITVAAVSLLLTRYYDIPVRAWINKRSSSKH